MSKPIVQMMIDDLTAVLDKYRDTYQVSYCEVIGCLEIISRDIYGEAATGGDDDEDDAEGWKGDNN